MRPFCKTSVVKKIIQEEDVFDNTDTRWSLKNCTISTPVKLNRTSKLRIRLRTAWRSRESFQSRQKHGEGLFINIEEETHRSGVLNCVGELMRKVLSQTGDVSSTSPFNKAYRAVQRNYSFPWDFTVYELMTNKIIGNSSVLINLYYDGTTLSKSSTQSTSMLRVRFINIQEYGNHWFDAGIEPNLSPSIRCLSDAKRPYLDLQLFERFVFLSLHDMLLSSHDICVVDGWDMFPRLFMVVED